MWLFKRCKHDWYKYRDIYSCFIYNEIAKEFGLCRIEGICDSQDRIFVDKICLKCKKIVSEIDDKYSSYRRKAMDTIADLEFKDKLLKKHKLGKYKEENSGQTN